MRLPRLCSFKEWLLAKDCEHSAKQRILSQGDVEKRTGLLRCYTSRVENGVTVPSVETLEKYARALEVPMYRLFYDGDKPQSPKLRVAKHETEWGTKGKEHGELRDFAKLLSRLDERQRNILLQMALHMARKRT
jgi:transcriptional regulator with XRE-family HTH domain